MASRIPSGRPQSGERGESSSTFGGNDLQTLNLGLTSFWLLKSTSLG